MYPSFAAFMEQCLYDEELGYYGAGKVEFGGDPHFWTYPRLVSPLFGWALAERVREVAQCWTELGCLNEEDRFTVLELGGGDGCLARDFLDYVVERTSEPVWCQFGKRLEYVIGELSPSLRRRQEHRLQHHIDAGRARVVDCDARFLSWDGLFKGVVFCNELIDALPVEKLRFHGLDQACSRVHVSRIPRGESRLPVEERLLPLTQGWVKEDGVVEEPPTPLLEYLHSLHPLLADLDGCGLLPVDVHWPPSLPALVRRLSELLNKAGNVGSVMLLDYGGTSRHVLDPRSLGSHLRVYGADKELAHISDVYSKPGLRDITCDVDFTEVARLARASGLDVPRFAHQSAIDTGFASGEEVGGLDALGARLSSEVGYASGVARLVASRIIKWFRRSPCYWLMQLHPHHLPATCVDTSVELQVNGRALWTLASSVGRAQLTSALRQAGLHEGIAGRLKSCGDIAADLSDAGMLEHYHDIMDMLDHHGWLRPPGAACT